MTPSKEGRTPGVELLQKVVKRVGAEPVLDTQEAQAALAFGAVDGAIIDPDAARSSISKGGIVDQVQWSDDYTPFSSPIVVLINASSYGYEEMMRGTDALFSSDEDHCLAMTVNFDQQSVAEMRDLAAFAQGAGARVVAVTDIWRAAFDEMAAEQKPASDQVAEAVRDALSH